MIRLIDIELYIFIFHTFNQEKEARDYPDFDKIDTINIAPEIVDLMNI